MLHPRTAAASQPYLVVQSPDGSIGVYLHRPPYPLVQLLSPSNPARGQGGSLATDGVGVVIATGVGNKVVRLVPVPFDRQVSRSRRPQIVSL